MRQNAHLIYAVLVRKQIFTALSGFARFAYEVENIHLVSVYERKKEMKRKKEKRKETPLNFPLDSQSVLFSWISITLLFPNFALNRLAAPASVVL